MGRRTTLPTAVLVSACPLSLVITSVCSHTQVSWFGRYPSCQGQRVVLTIWWQKALVFPGETAEWLSPGISGPAPQTPSSCPAPSRLLSPLLQIVCRSLEDPSQVVRNAALFALGQFSENLQVSKAGVGSHCFRVPTCPRDQLPLSSIPQASLLPSVIRCVPCS